MDSGRVTAKYLLPENESSAVAYNEKTNQPEDVSSADTFSKTDLELWKGEFDATAKYGRDLWTNSAKVTLVLS